ncbi:MAG: transglutaminase family protein, partial [Verrucomicrobiota bacterium]
EVKLDDEAGAAGLLFCGDGGDVHYGFYPSGGSLRLTRFAGPDVFQWDILEQLAVAEYRPGEWNRLRVKVGPEEILCLVNGTEVARRAEAQFRSGRVGLCKFRGTEAEFRNFRVGKRLEEVRPDSEIMAQVSEEVEAYLAEQGVGRSFAVDEWAKKHPQETRASLAQTQEDLKHRLVQVERLLRDTHTASIAGEMAAVLEGPAKPGRLFHAALLVAKLDNPELSIDGYREALQAFGREAKGQVPRGKEVTLGEQVAALSAFLFEENGFHGSRLDFYHRSNSYVNEVMDDREGIPITLSVLYLEVARLAGLKKLFGLGLPGRFVVGYREEDEVRLIDVFEGGESLSLREAELMMLGSGEDLASGDWLEPEEDAAIIRRMLRNLVGICKQEGEPEKALPYVDLTLALEPDAVWARLDRMILRFQEDDLAGAKVDVQWLLQAQPPGLDLERLRQFSEQW